MVDPRRPPVGLTGLFDSGPPIDPRKPPTRAPQGQALRYGTHHRRIAGEGGSLPHQSKFAARTSTVNGWHELGPLLTINFNSILTDVGTLVAL
jgi:hypothetical protein